MLKREWGAESNGLFIPSNTATVVAEFAVEDLALGRTATLVPAFTMKDLALGSHTDDDDISCDIVMDFVFSSKT